MPEETIQKIKSYIDQHKVVIFMKGTPEAPQCGFSAATVQILKGFERPFTGVDILAHPDIRAALPDYSDWPTFPQVFINGKLAGGCDIMHELRDSGELKRLLDEAFAEK